MITARTLQPQDQISHYRIVGPLGAGGMGEVYLAQDQTLERSVALKILPPELVRSEERVRRFVREAKSASSLNHPNIVTIYEIGQDEVRAHEGAYPAAQASSSSVHFISMELVSGETLATRIHHDKTDLRTLMGYLAQAAEGLAKAHAAGIVHRDLKPSNIMVSKDGFAKVLDFGLAKLTERQSADPEATVGPSQAADDTNVGAVVGTVGYMSPEQVRGGAVDHRSDIFSFGCILYEAATRKRPFVSDSNVETMHKILHDKPEPIEDLNKAVPAELRRLVRRCLAKNPEQRFQSAKDLAIELREIVDEYDSLSPSGSSGSGSSALGAGAGASARKRIPAAALIGGAAVVAAIVVVGIVMIKRGGDSGTGTSAPTLRISTVTSRGVAISSALSPDGRYLAYVLRLEGLGSIWVRQVATGSDVRVLEPQKVSSGGLGGLAFTPDGNYLYYQSPDPDREGYTAIFEIPTLGGTPRKRTYDVDSRVTFSPDGKQMCFYRGMPQKNQDALVIFDIDSGKERLLATASPPVSLLGAPAWSPDGKRIAAIETRGGQSLGATLVTFRVEDGRREPIGKEAWVGISGISWLPDGSGLVISAFDRSTFAPGQLWLVTYPEGRVKRLTSDANFYSSMSVSADGQTIAAVRGRQETNLWHASPAGALGVRQVTFGTAEEGSVGRFDPAQDSTVVYGTIKDGSPQIWTVRADGTEQRAIISGRNFASSPFFRTGSGIIHHQSEGDLKRHVWRADANGENTRQLTTGDEETIVDVSPDGRTVLFQRESEPDVLWSVSSEGGEPARLGPSVRGSAQFSPDGSRIFHTLVHSIQGQGAFTPQIIPAKGGEPAVTPGLPPRADDVAWTSDGRALTYLHASNGFRNLFRLTLDGGEREEITRFADGRIAQHRWSPDGKRLLLLRRDETVGNLWVSNADGTNPVAVTDFETGNISGMEWSLDGSQIIFTYGEASQNVVLVRNFR